MDALDVARVCLRRWYVVLPIVVLSIASGLSLAQHQKPTYESTGTYVLIYPGAKPLAPVQADPRAANPLGSNGVLLGEAVVSDLMDLSHQDQLGKAGTSGTAPSDSGNGTSYNVSLPDNTSTYVVHSWGSSPAALKTVITDVLRASAASAKRIQERAGAPEDSQYTTLTTSAAQVRELPSAGKVKILIAMVGLGLLVGGALSILFDAVLRRRGNRRRRRQNPSVEALRRAVDRDDHALSPRMRSVDDRFDGEPGDQTDEGRNPASGASYRDREPVQTRGTRRERRRKNGTDGPKPLSVPAAKSGSRRSNPH